MMMSLRYNSVCFLQRFNSNLLKIDRFIHQKVLSDIKDRYSETLKYVHYNLIITPPFIVLICLEHPTGMATNAHTSYVLDLHNMAVLL